MEPFNIKISEQGHPVVLTILPADEGYYKVIYYGGVLGAVKHNGSLWSAVPQDQLIAGDLPFYQSKPEEERVELVLNEELVAAIGDQIDAYQQE